MDCCSGTRDILMVLSRTEVRGTCSVWARAVHSRPVFRFSVSSEQYIKVNIDLWFSPLVGYVSMRSNGLFCRSC
jgi:hypothetical protein